MAAIDGREEAPSPAGSNNLMGPIDKEYIAPDGGIYVTTESYLMGGDYVFARPTSSVCSRREDDYDDLTEQEVAMVEQIFPKKWLTDLYAEKGLIPKVGFCEWCRHVHRMMVPASSCDVKLEEETKVNAIKIKKLGKVKEVADVRKLFEGFEALQTVEIWKGCAVARFVNLDAAERAMEKLKGDGYDVEWYV